MDRRVKERLIGATILVVLIVLIAPALLSGPRHAAAPPTPTEIEPVRNVTVDLATSKAMPQADAATAGPAAATPPAPAPTTSAPTSSEPSAAGAGEDSSRALTGDEEAPVHRAPAPTISTLQAQRPPPLENDPSPPTTVHESAPSGGTHHGWAVQVGSFASSANAEKLQRRLKTENFSATISSSGAGRALRYRVRLGPLPDRIGAERLIARLRKSGHSASVVSP